MNVGIYSTAFNANRNNFDYKNAIENWACYAQNISIAINTSDDGTYDSIYEFAQNYMENHHRNISIIQTDFSYDDPFCYGKIENAALQNCNADLYIQQNLDERLIVELSKLEIMYNELYTSGCKAYFIPTIDLYKDVNRYISINKKWYMHLGGLFRGPVKFGIKPDGRPDYNITSTDELIDSDGNLVKTIPTYACDNLEVLSSYVKLGYPLVYHLGYLNLNDRAERAKWWKNFWEKATGGDPNTHITNVEELLERETKEHNLPPWPLWK